MKHQLKSALSQFGVRMLRDTPSSRSEHFLHPDFEMAVLPIIRQLADQFFFVEIGANDGSSSDRLYPLVREFNLRGLLVEPEPSAFQRLQSTYAGTDGLFFENAAISSHGGELRLYRLKPDYRLVPGVLRQDFDTRVTSFDPTTVLKHIGYSGPSENVLEQFSVPALTPTELLQRHNVSHVSLLQIDTEGADWEILQSWDFEKFAPIIVTYEHLHLGVDNFERSIDFLVSRGYRWCKGECDVLAMKRPELR
jgi:FkbM family methyltransferase